MWNRLKKTLWWQRRARRWRQFWCVHKWRRFGYDGAKCIKCDLIVDDTEVKEWTS